ncbi:MAG: pirin family protein [Bacteroidota bacterium]
MKRKVYPAHQRGHFDHGWLSTYHTFSFGRYHNPHSMNFGALRVLNDDVLQGGGGFGAHGHENMEIISVPLQGALAHSDSMGHVHVIRPNDVQVMSAGTGIMHAEYNHSAHDLAGFLQLWILPETKNISPRYAQHRFSPKEWENNFRFLVGPKQQDYKLGIHQQAFVARASIEAGKTICYTLQRPAHGVYMFVIEGKVNAAGVVLNKRDGIGIEDTHQLVCLGVEACDVLVIEVPMQF